MSSVDRIVKVLGRTTIQRKITCKSRHSRLMLALSIELTVHFAINPSYIPGTLRCRTRCRGCDSASSHSVSEDLSSVNMRRPGKPSDWSSADFPFTLPMPRPTTFVRYITGSFFRSNPYKVLERMRCRFHPHSNSDRSIPLREQTHRYSLSWSSRNDLR
jgi:hypothetical protein